MQDYDNIPKIYAREYHLICSNPKSIKTGSKLQVKDLDEDTSKADEAREMGVPVELVETFREKYSL